MDTIRLTTAQAVVRWLTAQRTIVDGEERPLFAGAFGIFGHGNVTSLAEALQPVQDELPTWRGQNEQSMALAAVAYAKAMRGRQTWSLRQPSPMPTGSRSCCSRATRSSIASSTRSSSRSRTSATRR
jgi:TPP-dependent trihydroxycyclohexane-1,2-dione (THcHDO) dehydratase